MNLVYKWSRFFALIYVIFLFIVVTIPFAITILNGVDESTPALLMTATVFLIPLVFSALSFRFMHKNETEKKRKIGFGILVTLSIALLGFSFYQERQYQLMIAQNEMLQETHEAKMVSETLKRMIEEVEAENSLEQLNVPE